MPYGTLEELEPYLKGLMYPATKKDIMEQAKKNNAEQPVLETLESINKEKFYSHKDVVEELEKIV